jgi:hypothetical protein
MSSPHRFSSLTMPILRAADPRDSPAGGEPGKYEIVNHCECGRVVPRCRSWSCNFTPGPLKIPYQPLSSLIVSSRLSGSRVHSPCLI